jgi:hypothetical protein
MAHLMKFPVRGSIAAVLALACAAPAQAADVTVRVEGSSSTLLAPTAVTTGPGTFTKAPGAPLCQRDSAGGALETATAGSWGGAFDGWGQRVETILGETHVFGSGAYWSIYVNASAASQGACTQPVQTGDAITFYPQCEGAPLPACFDGLLLLASAPATVTPGAAATIAVDQVTTTYEPPTWEAVTRRTPAVGATVDVGGGSAVVGADGRAAVPVGAQTGVQSIRATLAGRVRASGALCVTNGADGACGTTLPGQVLGAGSAAQAPAAPCATAGDDGRCGTRDTLSPRSTLAGVADRQAFRTGQGPRRLAGSIDEASGVLMVKLRIHRRAGRSCSYFSGRQERFRRIRCGVANAKWFTIGDRADWSYLLPARLPRGEYVIDVNAIDRAYNRDDGRERGRNRMHVRVG